MGDQKYDLCDRLLEFAVEVILYLRTVKNTIETMDIKRQLIKAVTSTGSNYEEAQGAPTRPDFKTKVGISLKEMREVYFLLRLLHRLNWGDRKKSEIIIKEALELRNILGSIINKL